MHRKSNSKDSIQSSDGPVVDTLEKQKENSIDRGSPLNLVRPVRKMPVTNFSKRARCKTLDMEVAAPVKPILVKEGALMNIVSKAKPFEIK